MASLAPSEPSFVKVISAARPPTIAQPRESYWIACFERRVDPTIPPGRPTRVCRKAPAMKQRPSIRVDARPLPMPPASAA